MYHADVPEYRTGDHIASFMWGVYGWMSVALLLTSCTAYYVAATPSIFNAIHSRPGILLLLFVGQIGLVLALSLMLPRLTVISAIVMFLLYATSVGLTLSVILHIYTAASITSTFLTTAGMFGAMAIYGYVTRADLTSIGSISIMMLVGLIIGFTVNMFFQNPMMDMILSGIGVIVFSLLTAYDTQKIKQIGAQLHADQQTIAKVTILGALTLYLDFINLFLYLLRFLGKRRDE